MNLFGPTIGRYQIRCGSQFFTTTVFQEDTSTSDSRREKSWLKLLLAVQQSKSTSSERIQLVLQLLDMIYDSGTKVNAIHISAAVTVSYFSCP